MFNKYFIASVRENIRNLSKLKSSNKAQAANRRKMKRINISYVEMEAVNKQRKESSLTSFCNFFTLLYK